jgi:hypothetical protein
MRLTAVVTVRVTADVVRSRPSVALEIELEKHLNRAVSEFRMKGLSNVTWDMSTLTERVV